MIVRMFHADNPSVSRSLVATTSSGPRASVEHTHLAEVVTRAERGDRLVADPGLGGAAHDGVEPPEPTRGVLVDHRLAGQETVRLGLLGDATQGPVVEAREEAHGPEGGHGGVCLHIGSLLSKTARLLVVDGGAGIP